MRLFKIEFGYLHSWEGDSDENKVNHEKKIVQRKAACVFAGIQFNDKHPEDVRWEHPGETIVNDSQLVDLVGMGQEVKVVKEISVPSGDVSNLPDIVEKLSRLAEKLTTLPKGDPYAGHLHNGKVEVHVPGPALSIYNEVQLMEDACTDALQCQLDDGWRIISACPQSQRRPDYILGRFNPNHESNGKGAKRG